MDSMFRFSVPLTNVCAIHTQLVCIGRKFFFLDVQAKVAWYTVGISSFMCWFCTIA